MVCSEVKESFPAKDPLMTVQLDSQTCSKTTPQPSTHKPQSLLGKALYTVTSTSPPFNTKNFGQKPDFNPPTSEKLLPRLQSYNRFPMVYSCGPVIGKVLLKDKEVDGEPQYVATHKVAWPEPSVNWQS